MELNIPLIRKTMEYIEAHPDEWNQKYWFATSLCGTTMCFAGTVAYLAGATFPENNDGYYCTAPDGRVRSIENFAIEQLGLSAAAASDIFLAEPDSPQKMRELVEEIIGEKL